MKTIRDAFMTALCWALILAADWLLDMNSYPQG